MNRYSTKVQEQRFQPRRVRVLVEEVNHLHSIPYKLYHVVSQDLVTHRVEELTKRRDFTKAEAIAEAKRQAVAGGLPFDLVQDLLDQEEATQGPWHGCLLCAKSRRRTWEPFVCEDCQRLYRQGAEAAAERLVVRVYGTLRQTYDHLSDDQVSRLLAVLSGNVPHEEHGPYDRAIKTHEHQGVNYGGGPCWALTVRLTEQQADAWTRLVELLGAVVEDAFVAGKREGSSLLDKLVKGEVHPNQFSDLREKP